MKRKSIHIKNVQINELERTLNKCLAYFYAFPQEKRGLTELSALIKSSKTAVKQVVESLVKIQFLNKEVVGKAWLISANQKHSYFITKKVPFNLNLVYESGIIEAVYKMIPSPRAVILFGSYRWGTDIEGSDIDIAVEVLNNKELEITCLGVIKQLGYRKNVLVNLHIFSRNRINSNLFANIANGIVLDGFLEAKV